MRCANGWRICCGAGSRSTTSAFPPGRATGSPGSMPAARCSISSSTMTKSACRSACRPRIGRGPQGFHLVERQVAEAGGLLNRAKALLELAIGFAQRGFRLDIEMACEVDDGEQQVAELVELAVVVGLGVEFGQFLVDLGPRAGDVGPVEPGARRAALELVVFFLRIRRPPRSTLFPSAVS